LHLGFIPHPRTIYQGVWKLAPGHRLDFNAGGAGHPERYYDVPPSDGPVPPYDTACAQVRNAIRSAVQRQRVADVPLGAFLSGGLDSSIVVACLAEKSSQPIKTFSIGYADHPRYDETSYAQAVADHFRTEHHAFRLSFQDVLDTIEPMVAHLGEPFADSSLLPTSVVSRHTRQHVTVALSGDGGDELFGGYWRYLGHHYLKWYRRCPAILRKGVIERLLSKLPSARSTHVLDRLRQASKLLRGDLPDAMDRHLAWSRFIDEPTAEMLLGVGRAGRASESLTERFHQAATNWELGRTDQIADLQKILLADLNLSLPGDMLHKVDTASMFHGLEVRVPLLASEVVQLVADLPVEYKLAGRNGKRILRDAFREVLPPAVISRRKMGFEVPIGEFLRRELREMYQDVVNERALRTFGISPAGAAALYGAHCRREADHTELLWSLLVLCGWGRQARIT
jgi:asparagine synthase (glutamine-hydrolysing)